MQICGRQVFLTALATAFAALALVYPSVSVSHALDHLEATEVGGTSGEEPTSEAAEAELCDLCISLSQGRSALLAAAPLAPVHASLISHRENAPPPPVLSRLERAPASPRAPPLH